MVSKFIYDSEPFYLHESPIAMLSLTHSPTHCSSYFDILWTLEMPASITIYGLETCFFSLPDSSPQIILRLIPLWFLSLNSNGITGTSRDLHLSTTLVCFFFFSTALIDIWSGLSILLVYWFIIHLHFLIPVLFSAIVLALSMVCAYGSPHE